jgi:DNA-binding response OmpR family regulator
MNNGAHVLVVSRDETLLQTRQLILGAFFQVNGAGRVQEAESLITKRAFDLIVLCYSLSPSDCARVLDLIREQNPRPKILTLRAAGTPAPSQESDAELMIEAGPYGLLKKSAEILGVDLKAKPQPSYVRDSSAA